MLKISKQETVAGITVFGDDTYDDVYYAIPETPRFRVDDNGTPIFKFLKYRNPIDRQDGKRGGGFVFFDTEFTLTNDQLQRVTEALQTRVEGLASGKFSSDGPRQVRFGSVTYTRGTAGLLLKEDGGQLVEAVRSAGKPSLFGKNVAAFMVEFTPEGATLFEQALQGKGGVVQVVYDLYFWAKLPEIYARAWFEADAFYSYEQEITIDWSLYGDDEYVEKIVENFEDNETMGVEYRFDAVIGTPEEDRKLKERIKANLDRSLQDAVIRQMIPDIEAIPRDARGIPEDVEKMKRSFETTKVASFENEYRENAAVEWNLAPQGTLPNITNLVDNEGKAIRWDEHATLVDLDDPFFKQLNVKVGVNADFEALPIHSIEVKLEYKQGDQHQLAEYSFKSPDDNETFRTYIADDVRDYTYSYQVNYVGSSRTFVSTPATTSDTVLTVNVDDIGLLDVDVEVGDIDWKAVRSAQATVRYADTGIETFEEQFTLTEGDPKQKVQHVLFQPRRKPIEYRVDYVLNDGRQIATDWEETERSPILVNDPLGRTQRFEVRGVGDFANRIEQVLIDLVYRDDANDYSVEESVVLTAGNTEMSRPYAVIGNGGGTVTYKGFVRYKDGTVRDIPEQTADGTIVVGDVVSSKLAVSVLGNLLDWSQVRLARVALRRADGVGNADLIFGPQTAQTQTWEVALDVGDTRDYTWQATYFLADNSQHDGVVVPSSEPSIVLQAPTLTPAPVTPVNPVNPVTPVVPVTPVAPVAPVDPVTPVAPVVPVVPVAPVDSNPTQGGSPPPPPTPGGSPPPPPMPGGSPPPPPQR